MGDIRVVDLFAGGGGMGLAFLAGRRARKRARLLYSAECHPRYLQSLRRNTEYFGCRIGSEDQVPQLIHATDVTDRLESSRLFESVRSAGGLDVLLGGPPCQGFSTANSQRDSNHPLNDLVLTFAEYANALKPKVVILENVPGLAHKWKTDPDSKLTQLLRMLRRNFQCYHSILDAVDFGVPQRRQRFFLLAINRELGLDLEFEDVFPKPTHGSSGRHPFVTVRDAIGDLPRVDNGESRREQVYRNQKYKNSFAKRARCFVPDTVLWDHVVSRNSHYVIRRYSLIKPGENLQSIRGRIRNYNDISQAHSNIYRRLRWDEPSVTIGNFRKSMIIHPEQDRGLSLREAARLQSLPDWFGFVPRLTAEGRDGLNHHQQQVGNAVSFLLTMAISEHIVSFL